MKYIRDENGKLIATESEDRYERQPDYPTIIVIIWGIFCFVILFAVWRAGFMTIIWNDLIWPMVSSVFKLIGAIFALLYSMIVYGHV